MIPLALPVPAVPKLFVSLASPASPTSIPFTSFGPYTFLVVIAWLLWFAGKEYRKGRAEEVDAHKEEATRQRARADTIEIDLNRQNSGLRDDLTNLGREVESLRDNHINETAQIGRASCRERV